MTNSVLFADLFCWHPRVSSLTLPSFLLLAVYFQLSVSAEVGGGRGGAWEGLEGWEWRGMGGVSCGRDEPWKGWGNSFGQRIQSVSHGPWKNSASCSGVEDTSDHEQIAPASILTTIIAVSWRLLKLSDAIWPSHPLLPSSPFAFNLDISSKWKGI